MAEVTKIYDMLDLNNPEKPRQRKLLSKVDDLMIALNHYAPGARNEFHYHKGSSQSFLCVKGKLTVRTKDSEDAEPVTHQLTEGMCVLIPGNQYYQLHNESNEPALLYQVKKPGDQIVVAGRGQLNNRDYFTKDRQAEVAL
jgi:mannose-6-phosphate isomerase-like protein (cupin superfamily)